MKNIKFVKEDALNGYIATDDEIITLVGTQRPDLDFDTLRNVIYTYNAYVSTGLAPKEIKNIKLELEKYKSAFELTARFMYMIQDFIKER